MDLEPKGCLFPKTDVPGVRVQDCTLENCKTHPIHSFVSARCPTDKDSTIAKDPNPSSTSVSSEKFVRTRCMVNRTTEVFYWLPPVQDCFSVSSDEPHPYFFGSIYTLRQLHQAFQLGKTAAVTVREKPLVSLSVGMSALSVVLVLIMLLGVCYRNVSDVGTAGGFSGSNAAQRQRQAAARRRARARNRRRENGNRNSIGTQADVAEPSDRLFILPRPEFTRRVETGGVNAGFNDSEALLAQPQELSGQTPALLTVLHEEDLALPDRSELTERRSSVDQSNRGPGGEGGSGGEGRVLIITTGCEEELSRLSCLAVPHVDVPPAEYQPPPPQPPKVLKSPPMLPSYEDATKRGMYCIIRPTDISSPPAYELRLPNHTDGDSISLSTTVFPSINSWDLHTYGVHRGSVNSMPEFSRIFGPPESPYPGDSPQ